MNDTPREKLCEIIATYGRAVCDEPRRCEGLLKDYCSEYKREVFVLVSALLYGNGSLPICSPRLARCPPRCYLFN